MSKSSTEASDKGGSRGAKNDAIDFYDILQLLLLRDTNLLFVTDDRLFFQYYVSAEHHRVLPWKLFKNS